MQHLAQSAGILARSLPSNPVDHLERGDCAGAHAVVPHPDQLADFSATNCCLKSVVTIRGIAPPHLGRRSLRRSLR